MKFHRIQLITLLLFGQLLYLNYAIADSFFDDEDVIWQSGSKNYFKYETLNIKKLSANNHPVELSEKEIANALESLKIWEKDIAKFADEGEPVFSIAVARKLGKFIAKGLKRAKPNQDIIFLVQSTRPKLLLLTQKFVSAGRAFYKDGKLNIIIGDYNYPINDALEKVLDPAGQSTSTFIFNHGSRSGGNTGFKEAVLKVPGIENKKLKKTRRNWFVIDISRASEAYIALKKEKQNPVAKRDKQLEIETAKMAKERREMRLEMARIRKEMKEQGGSSSQLSVEDRLTRLEELKQQELISESEYNEQRTKILEEL